VLFEKTKKYTYLTKLNYFSGCAHHEYCSETIWNL
jgi:hypothetical protein